MASVQEQDDGKSFEAMAIIYMTNSATLNFLEPYLSSCGELFIGEHELMDYIPQPSLGQQQLAK